MKAKGAIFDLDGTLIDSLASIGETVNEVLESRGHPGHPMSAYRYFAGDGAELLMKRALPEAAREPHYVKECLHQFHETYPLRWRDTVVPFEGITELLSSFEARDVRLAVLSNKVDVYTKQMTSEIFPGLSFAAVLGLRIGTPKKPDPTAAHEIARTLGLTPGEMLFVGDTNVDIETGVAAGMIPVGVTWGFRDEDELRKSGARCICTTPGQLLDLV